MVSAANFALGLTGLPRGHKETNRVCPGHANPVNLVVWVLKTVIPKIVLHLFVEYMKSLVVSVVSIIMQRVCGKDDITTQWSTRLRKLSTT